MSNQLRVRVTQQHIDEGRACPVKHACAIKRALEDAGFPDASVGVTAIWLDGIFGDRFASMPKHVEKFRHAFDYGLPVSPFEFDLDIRTVVRV